MNEKIKFNILKRKYYCSMCGEEMILRHNSLGMFWQCPYCGNAVITPVAKEVAEEEIKHQGKEKEMKVCPNYGERKTPIWNVLTGIYVQQAD